MPPAPDQTTWQASLDAFNAYVAANGHGRVPQRYVTDDGLRLGKWVARQRTERDTGKILAERAATLEATPGWVWNARAADWDAVYTLVVAHVDENNALPVKEVIREGVPIGDWCRYQRTRYREGQLSEQHARLLESIPGWFWGTARGHGVAAPRRQPLVPRDEWAGHSVLEVRAAGDTLKAPVAALIACADDAPVSDIVAAIIAALDLDDDYTHLWRLAVPPADPHDGSRKLRDTMWHPQDIYPRATKHGDWTLLFSSNACTPHDENNPRMIDDLTLQEVLADRDEANLLHDFGDCNQVRIRRIALDSSKLDTAQVARDLLDNPELRERETATADAGEWANLTPFKAEGRPIPPLAKAVALAGWEPERPIAVQWVKQTQAAQIS
jgi:Helicase associated domain